ncbi:MAG UNVERIFIED_CONTAM: hypothetical protein LVT10_07460 [Anaerolineae bacterium]
MTQKRVGVIGWPIERSLSPAMHNAAFEALGMQDEWYYDKSAIPPEILKKSLREFMMHGYVGLNVTVPFKQEVVALFRSDPIVQAVGAANTLVFPRNEATNTDVFGFIDDLQAHGIPLKGQTVILSGQGGTRRPLRIDPSRRTGAGHQSHCRTRTSHDGCHALAHCTSGYGTRGIGKRGNVAGKLHFGGHAPAY